MAFGDGNQFTSGNFDYGTAEPSAAPANAGSGYGDTGGFYTDQGTPTPQSYDTGAQNGGDSYGGYGGWNRPQRALNMNPLAGMNGAMGALGRLWNPLGDSLAAAQGAGGSGYYHGGGGGHFNYLQYLQGRSDLMHRYGDRVDALGQNLVSRGLSNSTADVAPRLSLARAENQALMGYNQRMLGPYQAAFQASHDVPAMVDSYGGKLRSDLVARGLGKYNDPNLELGLMRTEMQGLGDAGIGYSALVEPQNRIPGYYGILNQPVGSA